MQGTAEKNLPPTPSWKEGEKEMRKRKKRM
jgi:hypothetical protein